MDLDVGGEALQLTATTLSAKYYTQRESDIYIYIVIARFSLKQAAAAAAAAAPARTTMNKAKH